ncbi:MAG: hypothetical protein JST23_08980 [Bacteroidetes bacterium]|nr:hypothetical protein [Bacteroidota bacterium]
MKLINRYFFILFPSLLIHFTAIGQCNVDSIRNFKPAQRLYWHDDIDREQRNLLKWDGKADDQLTVSDNEEVNFLATKAATTTIDCFQYRVEKDSTLDAQKKIGYLRWYAEFLKMLQKNWSDRSLMEKVARLKPTELPTSLSFFEQALDADRAGNSLLELVKKMDYATASLVIRSSAFVNNKELADCKNELLLKYCHLFPQQILPTLMKNPDVPFADSLIRLAAKRDPKQLYDYAQADNRLGVLIRSIKDDSLITAIAKIAKSKDGQQYFCFLDNILNGKTSYDEIDNAKTDSLKYYRLLVKTHIDYVARTLNKDTAFEYETLNKRMMQKAKENFVNIINGLHTETAEVRFKNIQNLTPEELYYLAVSSDGIIYTSSFVKGVYPLMMKKLNNRGDSILKLVYFDKYRKFIKMCAGYNKLSEYLASFPAKKSADALSDAEVLMKSFVKNLEKSNGTEDAVDVADSYASIAESMKPLANDMLRNVQDNYNRNVTQQNKRGIAIYKILNELFLSADSTKKIDLAKDLGIPPVYDVPYTALKNGNDSGRVIIQQFFYGDKDGQGVFNGFLKAFNNPNWKIINSDQWVEVRSVKGKPVSIFANRALNEEDGLDEKAQKALCNYLEDNKLFPTITIHRGHSYYADATIAQMFPTSKIVFMGSCGGYHLLHDILNVSSDAHIVATKQIGDTKVNLPFVILTANKMRMGEDIRWVPFWNELKKAANSPEFEDYVPPYKNLGALFIKAYKIAMGGDE